LMNGVDTNRIAGLIYFNAVGGVAQIRFNGKCWSMNL
jgi:hypothetical protein